MPYLGEIEAADKGYHLLRDGIVDDDGLLVMRVKETRRHFLETT